MNFLKKLFGINGVTKQKAYKAQQTLTNVEANSRRRGLIRYVLLVASHPVQPTTPQMSAFLLELLPEFESQKNGTAKVGLLWETKSMHLIDVQSIAIESFGSGIMDANKYIYRTLHIGIKGGEAKCFVVYDVASN